MSMSKKDFIALADAIREHNEKDDPKLPDGVLFNRRFKANHLETLANFCAQQNPRFMRDRWLGYIAGENGKNGGKVRP